jgi:murein L,D-transpeptidase YcbB/YkuD
MKNTGLLFASIALFFTACQNMVKSDAEKDGSPDTEVSIDQTITAENAYSDLFLDSSALSKYINQHQLDEAQARQLRNFYNGRNFQAAWFNSDGLTEQGVGFWNLFERSNDNEEDLFSKRMDSLVGEDSLRLTASDTTFANTELALTHRFLQYAGTGQDNNPVDLNLLRRSIPVKKMNTLAMADSLLNLRKDSNQVNRRYAALKQHLSRYREAAEKGGWQPISMTTPNIVKGTSSPAITAIKNRLRLTGEYGNDTSAVFNDSLEVAIKGFQMRHGFQPTGIISDTLVRTMNVPVQQRIQQILVNMNRTVWAPASQPATSILVNIPAFKLQAFHNNAKEFDMDVIVGKEGTTTLFTGDMNEVVFSPYWNLPQSIVRDEILPAMKKDASYLKKRNMEVVEQGEVPTIRQLPGKENALGKVKFLFPNSHDIYLHDTPAKELFNQKQRAFSHGCIRVANAAKLAQFLLRDQQEWTPEKITQAMNAGKEQRVKITNPVTVDITYQTAWTDEQGNLHFREDVYGLDQRTAARMFLDAQAPVAINSPGQAAGADTVKRTL